ncbi:hypothetical protein [Vibrio parahaemolyticus]|uniref:hypothetical protein n=1 Tax=Vibrio parahaemolyticus TaxID=670 RepID=UPI00044FD3F8|nr:hypothetical protein [Vibrio parahaemolyticus]ETZ09179.1 hypothetical protein AJ90_07535 [Vibrio parahaemolyticus M0605]MBD6964649.1 hypothetical protein [Vibrio parahaemolyticus]
MNKNYRVVDKTRTYEDGYLKLVFFRSHKLRDRIGRMRWILVTLTELMVGAELLESLLVTASVPPSLQSEKAEYERFGLPLHLSMHIPMGFVTKKLKFKILEVLYYKYCLQYMILESTSPPKVNELEKIINCTRTKFRVNKYTFYQFIALRRVYDLSWLVFNISLDLLIYVWSNDLNAALLSALFVEGLRRAIKV